MENEERERHAQEDRNSEKTPDRYSEIVANAFRNARLAGNHSSGVTLSIPNISIDALRSAIVRVRDRNRAVSENAAQAFRRLSGASVQAASGFTTASRVMSQSIEREGQWRGMITRAERRNFSVDEIVEDMDYSSIEERIIGRAREEAISRIANSMYTQQIASVGAITTSPAIAAIADSVPLSEFSGAFGEVDVATNTITLKASPDVCSVEVLYEDGVPTCGVVHTEDGQRYSIAFSRKEEEAQVSVRYEEKRRVRIRKADGT